MMRVVRHWNLVAQRSCGSPVPVPAQARQGSEQPDVVKDVSPHGKGVELGGLQRSFPFQTIL